MTGQLRWVCLSIGTSCLNGHHYALIYLFICLFVFSFIHLFIILFIHSIYILFVCLFVCLFHLFIHLFIHWCHFAPTSRGYICEEIPSDLMCV